MCPGRQDTEHHLLPLLSQSCCDCHHQPQAPHPQIPLQPRNLKNKEPTRRGSLASLEDMLDLEERARHTHSRSPE